MFFNKYSLITGFMALTTVGLLFLGSFSNAYASLTPQKSLASGGGCTPYSQPQGNASIAFAQYQSCISGGYVAPYLAPEVTPDAYFNFSAQNPSFWTACEVTISTIDANGITIDGPHMFDCLNDARVNASGVYFSGQPHGSYIYVSSHSGYYNKVGWYGIYSGHFYQGLNFLSPEQFV